MSTPESPSEPVFDLRCRDAEWIDRPRTLAEFARPAPREAGDPHAALAELLAADLIARAHYQVAALAGDRVILSLETPRYGIPLGVHDLDAPATDDWRIRELVGGELLDFGPDGRIEGSLAMQIRRGLIAVAGALPLLTSPLLAHASAPPIDPGIERLLGFAPPKLPEDAPPQPTEAAPASPAEGPATPQPDTTAAPTTPPPPVMTGESLALSGSSVWAGLLGKRVELALKNDQLLDGTIVAQSSRDLAVARAGDGTIVAVPKAEVGGVRLIGTGGATDEGGVPYHDRPTQDGRGNQAGGIVMVTFGSIAALAGTVMLALSPYYLFISLPLLLPGLAVIGGGASLMVSGAKKRKAYNKAWGLPNAKLHLTPTLAASRSGGQVGLVLKF